MFSGLIAPTADQIRKGELIGHLRKSDPDGLEVLIRMEGDIQRERYERSRCEKAAARLLAGDPRWIDEIRTSNEYEALSLLGRSVAEAFKSINQKAGV